MSYQREFSQRLRVGVVGLGSHCYRNILPAMHYLPVELEAFCDVNLELARRTAKEYGVLRCYAHAAEMYREEKLDAVILCVSASMHPVLAMEAFAAGLHVWMEKPAAMRVADVEEMLSKRKDRVAVVGFKKAFMPALTKVRELLSRESHQPLHSILAQYAVTVPKDGESVLREGRATDWLANGCHPLSFLAALGGAVVSVTTHHGGRSSSLVVLDFASGAQGTLHAACGAGNSQPAECYTIYAEGATISVENSQTVTYQRGIPFEYGKSTTYAPPGLESGAVVWRPQNCLATLENHPLMTQGMYDSLRIFCEQAMGSVTPAQEATLEFARDVVQLYEAALLSNGKKVILEELFGR